MLVIYGMELYYKSGGLYLQISFIQIDRQSCFDMVINENIQSLSNNMLRFGMRSFSIEG